MSDVAERKGGRRESKGGKETRSQRGRAYLIVVVVVKFVSPPALIPPIVPVMTPSQLQGGREGGRTGAVEKVRGNTSTCSPEM